MSAINEVIHRTMEDEEFVQELRADPESALAEYDLSESDLQQLESRIQGEDDDSPDNERKCTVFSTSIV